MELDASLATLVEEVSTAEVQTDAEKGVWAIELTGRINGTEERAPSLFLLRAPHVAMIVSGFTLRSRENPELREALVGALAGLTEDGS